MCDLYEWFVNYRLLMDSVFFLYWVCFVCVFVIIGWLFFVGLGWVWLLDKVCYLKFVWFDLILVMKCRLLDSLIYCI